MVVFRLKLLALVMVFSGCAGELVRDQNLKRPFGGALEEVIDSHSLEFVSIDDQSSANLGEYFDKTKKDFILLMFGSRGCAVCTKKSIELQTRLRNEHPIFRDSDRFELIGVSTDPEASLGLVRRYQVQHGFDHIKWLDPNGEIMVSRFLPEGKPLGVPFSVLLTHDGVVWRVSNDEEISADLEAMLDKAWESIQEDPPHNPHETGDEIPDGGSDQDQAVPPVVVVQPTVPGPPASIPNGQLSVASANRLKGIKVKDCSGAEQDLHDRVGDGLKLLFVQPGSCDGECQNRSQKLLQVTTECRQSGECGAATLVPELSEGQCSEGIFKGGIEFLETFRSMYDWTVTPVMENWVIRMPEFVEPLLFVFDRDGEMLFNGHSPEVFTENKLREILAMDGSGQRANGFNWKFFADGTTQDFKDLRSRSEYTVIAGFERFCGSCQQELAVWNQPGHLYDYCEARPEKCQVLALENTEKDSYEGWAEELNAALAQSEAFTSLGVQGNRIPLIFDTAVSGADPDSGFLTRYYQGYLAASFPAFDQGWGGVVIYNREGRLVSKVDPPVPGEDPHPEAALEMVKSLVEGSQSGS